LLKYINLLMKGYILSSQKFHEIKYDILGDNYQRKHPVEYVIKIAKIS
jgi:hypothetical protein